MQDWIAAKEDWVMEGCYGDIIESVLEHLLAWVRSYETRTDEHGLRRHRQLFDSFQGSKREYNHPSQYESVDSFHRPAGP